ncbi:MAG: hypothetical protein ACI9FR_002064 [Cryomorphaceae bacterium]|jgi:hypothetical protein
MKNLIFSLLITFLLSSDPAAAKGPSFNLLKATPTGSWQLREEIVTNHKGKRTGSSIRSSMLGSEMRDGEKYYWIEMAINSFKIKKNGKRKKTGDRAIVKSLIPAATLEGDPANVMSNLRGFGTEIIVQNGKEDPMRMSDSGGMLAGIMQVTQAEIVFDFEDQGKESVSVPGGDFKANKTHGVGSVEMKVIFKKIRVESDTTMWLSSKVPFGTVKTEGTSSLNGKVSTISSEVIEYGASGAASEITKEPKDMPKMPDIFGG